ncbi:protein new-glue 1-like [Drosophila suzukii]|uniref:Protein new-glue 1-like n=1 Tax=Drosophila suzukii TaxID=28584 RepID=A0AB39ZLR0_DROSZ
MRINPDPSDVCFSTLQNRYKRCGGPARTASVDHIQLPIINMKYSCALLLLAILGCCLVSLSSAATGTTTTTTTDASTSTTTTTAASTTTTTDSSNTTTTTTDASSGKKKHVIHYKRKTHLPKKIKKIHRKRRSSD